MKSGIPDNVLDDINGLKVFKIFLSNHQFGFKSMQA